MSKTTRWLASSLLGAALLAAACSSDHSDPITSRGSGGEGGQAETPSGGNAGELGGGGDGGGDAGLDHFAAWRQLRAAVQQSPDHLTARAERLVADKDPEAMFEFVRDEILTYPPQPDGFYDAMLAQRWGTRATLRGGAGTPREKVELLLQMYREAGFEARVMRGKASPEQLTGEQVLLRQVERTFEPPTTPEELERWREAWGAVTPTPRSLIDEDGSEAESLFESLLEYLPADHQAPFDFTLTDFPLVEVQVDQAPRYANVIAPHAKFGESLSASTPTASSTAPRDPGRFIVRLEASRSDSPRERFPLLEADYAVEDVVGRRLQLSFTPPADITRVLSLRRRDVEAVLPSITVIAPELSEEERASLSFAGDVVTFGGDVYSIDESGVAALNGAPLPPLTTDPEAVARVAQLSAEVDGGGYPRVELRVTALDADGAPVGRLGSAAFSVTEDGSPVSFSLTRVEAPPPRVILLFDNSTSIPAGLRNAGAVEIGQQIVTELYTAHPDAKLQVGTIHFGYEPVSTAWASSLAEATQQVALVADAAGSSEIWQAVAEAQRLEPTVLVMVTDGDATDAESPRYVAGVAHGAPVLALNVTGAPQPMLQRLADLSGGSTALVASQAQVVAAALSEIARRDQESYIITYSSPNDAAGAHEVTVSCNGLSRVVSYDVPEVPAVPRALSSLYLTVEVNGRDVTRVVAGLAEGSSSTFPIITPAMLEDVRSALYGRILFSIEGAAPTAAQVVDDVLTDKLSLEPLWDAVEVKDDAGVLAALQQGGSAMPGPFALAHSPLPNAASEEALTFETGPRVAVLLQKFHDGGPSTSSLDLFSLSRWATAAEDATDAFERTLRATAALAIHEAALLAGESTLEALQGVPLRLMTPLEARTQPGLTPEQALQWSVLVQPFGSSYRLLAPLEPGALLTWAAAAGSRWGNGR
ncbi:MAG: hypothetical protein K0R38_4658 [Polyangiaceae bacterium]|nr:hypothetical protein [Polyangiaceae bacterium]